MAPFQYEQYRNPFVGSIGELMMQPARAQAQAELQKGAVWSNAADRIAQAVGSIPGQMAQQREQQQRDELIGGQLADARAHRAGNTAVDTLMQGDQLPANDAGPRQESYTDANGLFDVPKLNQALAHMGLGHMAPELLKGAESINESIANHQALEQKTAQAKTLIFGDMADGALKLAKLGMPVSDAMDFVVQPGIATGRIAPQEYAQLRQQIARLPPEQQAAALTTFMDAAAKIGGGETLAKDSQRLDRYGRVVATNAVEEPGKGDYTINGQRFSADGKPKGTQVPVQAPAVNPETERHNKELERIAGLSVGRQEAAQKETERHNRATEAAAAGDKTDLTPEGLDAAALNYAKTGQLPPLGMGDKTTRKQIINRAAAMMPGLDVASAKADFDANKASLTNATKTLDSLSAFENTAGKNLDQFLTLADKVPDTGMPWLNTPIRALSANVVGSENQAAFNAARDVALREIARVTNDPKLSGVLSDSARHEVSALSPQNATFAQIKAVAKVLKQDMANVHSSLSDQIAGIQGRIAKGAPGSTTSTGPVRMKAPNGQISVVPVDQVEHFKSLGATVVP